METKKTENTNVVENMDTEETTPQSLGMLDKTKEDSQATESADVLDKPNDDSQSETQQLISIIPLFLAFGFLCGVAKFLYDGFDKMYVYESWSSKNKYVGADAYNYIINANYSTAFFILALICAIFACTCILYYRISLNAKIK